MAKKAEEKNPVENVEDALSKTELFIEKNSKKLLGILATIVIGIGAFLAVREFYLKPLEQEANAAIFRAEDYFGKDSFNLALKGDKKFQGFLSIIDEYGSTEAGNLAQYYAGICYLNLGKYQDAIDHLEEYDGKDMLTSSFALGAKGDAHMELGKTQEAIDLYIQAAGKQENEYTTPHFLMKAAFAYEDQANYEKALEIYKKIQREFFKSAEGRDAEKYIARAEGLLNQKTK